ncbi:hypothetical protein FRC17_000347, partial [Serendipita sp. 399]
KESTLDAELDGVKYEPINIPSVATAPDQVKPDIKEKQTAHDEPKLAPTASKEEPVEPLDSFPLENKWIIPKSFAGLDNLGNSCFMNSTLQILLHTPPLVNIIIRHHKRQTCKISQSDRFCFTCNLRELAITMMSEKISKPKAPNKIFANLRKIAPSFRQYRQEDAHEFLRFSIDALQLAAQDGVKEVPDKVAATSWVHRLFGGQFRSRVTCGECGYNSDTFEAFLDLSVDVGKCDTLIEMLQKFSVVERLEGKNKYKCEKCNKPVNALKQITVHKAPPTLSIQLKRFTPWGRKLTHPIEYDERLSIQDAMSSGQENRKRKASDMMDEEEDVGKVVLDRPLTSPRLSTPATSPVGPPPFKKPRIPAVVFDIQNPSKKQGEAPKLQVKTPPRGTVKLDLRSAPDTDSDEEEPTKPSSPIANTSHSPSAGTLHRPPTDGKATESPDATPRDSSLDASFKKIQASSSPVHTKLGDLELNKATEESPTVPISRHNDSKSVPSWMNSTGTAQRPFSSKYTSKAKRKERANVQNPFGMVGISHNKNGHNVTFGSNKHRRPTGI